MNIICCDKSFHPKGIIDDYESFIWTDRLYSAGDFEIVVPATTRYFDLLKEGYYLKIRESDRVMIVEGFEISADPEDGNKLTVTGRSLESILDRRVVWGQTILDGNFQNGIKTLITENIINPKIEDRKIDNFIFSTSTDPRITSLTIDKEYTGDNLYDVISNLCKEHEIGFKITLNSSDQFVFELYAGVDRSFRQTDRKSIAFSTKLENLVHTNYQENISSYKNVSLVGGEGEGAERRYTSVGWYEGLERREHFTDARELSSNTNLFDSNNYSLVPIGIGNSSFTNLTPQRSIVVEIKPGSECQVRRDSSITTSMVLATSRGYPANYVSFSNKSEVGTDSCSVVANDDDHYLTVQLWGSSESSTAREATLGLSVNASMPDIQYVNLLEEKGNAELVDLKVTKEFESEIDTSSQYVYGRDFFMGDYLQIVNEYGFNSRVLITEMVRSDDVSGSNSYPAFILTNPPEDVDYFYIVPEEDSLISFQASTYAWTHPGYKEPRLKYSFDRVIWYSYEFNNSIEVSANTPCYFKGTNQLFSPNDPEYAIIFRSYKREGSSYSKTRFSAGGNIMSLLDEHCRKNIVPKFAFAFLFEGDWIVHPPKLPAKIVEAGAYTGMFQDCTALIEPPELPATTVGDYAYDYMFKFCDKLFFSASQSSQYPYEYRIPTNGNAAGTELAFTDMFDGTAGTYYGDGHLNTTYYRK